MSLLTESLAREVVGSRFLVSTVRRSPASQELDAAFALLGRMVGDEQTADMLDTKGEFETMVFGCNEDGDVLDWGELDFARYDSEDAALAGHAAMVKKWNEA